MPKPQTISSPHILFCITALPNTPFPSAPVSLRANICMPLCSDGLLENKAEDSASFWKLQGAMPLSLSSYDPGLQRSGVWPEHVGYFHVAQMSLAGGPIWGTTAFISVFAPVLNQKLSLAACPAGLRTYCFTILHLHLNTSKVKILMCSHS